MGRSSGGVKDKSGRMDRAAGDVGRTLQRGDQNRSPGIDPKLSRRKGASYWAEAAKFGRNKASNKLYEE